MREAGTLLFFASLLVALSGCGGGGAAGLYEVSGTVTFNGSALDHGTIRFDPADPADKTSQPGGGVIENGSYKIPRDKGLKPGKYLVFISSPEKSSKAVEVGGEIPAPTKERIPASFNTESRHIVEVKAEANEFNFTIP